MAYVVFVVVICAICFARLVCLGRRGPWRKDLDGQFPEACGDWAINGCTRVVLDGSKCTRPEDITF